LVESSQTGPDNISKPLLTPSWAIQNTENCCTTSPGEFVIPELLGYINPLSFSFLFTAFPVYQPAHRNLSLEKKKEKEKEKKHLIFSKLFYLGILITTSSP